LSTPQTGQARGGGGPISHGSVTMLLSCPWTKRRPTTASPEGAKRTNRLFSKAVKGYFLKTRAAEKQRARAQASKAPQSSARLDPDTAISAGSGGGAAPRGSPRVAGESEGGAEGGAKEEEEEEEEEGGQWVEVDFRFKPGRVDGGLPVIAPHQPRLDWQMWFAALSSYQSEPWLVSLASKLLKPRCPATDQLLAPATGPRETLVPTRVRARRYHYDLTRVASPWARRKEQGLGKGAQASGTAYLVGLSDALQGKGATWVRERQAGPLYLPALSQSDPSLGAFLDHHAIPHDRQCRRPYPTDSSPPWWEDPDVAACAALGGPEGGERAGGGTPAGVARCQGLAAAVALARRVSSGAAWWQWRAGGLVWFGLLLLRHRKRGRQRAATRMAQKQQGQ